MWEMLLLQVGIILITRLIADENEDTSGLEKQIVAAANKEEVEAIAMNVALNRLMYLLNEKAAAGDAITERLAHVKDIDDVKRVARVSLNDPQAKANIIDVLADGIQSLIRGLFGDNAAEPEWETCQNCGSKYPKSHMHICSD